MELTLFAFIQVYYTGLWKEPQKMVSLLLHILKLETSFWHSKDFSCKCSFFNGFISLLEINVNIFLFPCDVFKVWFVQTIFTIHIIMHKYLLP